MKKYVLLPAILFLFISNLSAQYYSNENKIWHFGNGAGLDFTSGTPVGIPSMIHILEGCGSVSSPSGTLLFYTDGKTVWDRTGAVMPSGSAIVSFSTGDAAEGAEIIPVIGNPNQYYIFSSDVYLRGFGHIAYSIVDMSLHGGLGDVLTPSGTLMGTEYAEKMVSIAGENCNVWLLTHRRDSASFWLYNVTTAGISAPVVTYIGTSASNNAGVVKASANRRKLVMQNCEGAGKGTELFDFDPLTGVVSNCQVIDAIGNNYGAEFSPDGTKLYCGELYGSTVWQYDVSLPTTADIIASKTAITTTTSELGDFKLGPDGKIYLTRYSIGFVDVINTPNASGSACGYTINAVALSAGSVGQLGLPNLYNAVGSVGATYASNDTLACIPSGGSIVIYPHHSASAYLWYDGVTTPYHTITALGNYWVREGIGCDPIIDTIKVSTKFDTIQAHTDTGVCIRTDNDKCTLTAPTGGINYIWYNGTTGTTSVINSSGSYWVAYTIACNLYVDTFKVKFNYYPVKITGPDTICTGNSGQYVNLSGGGVWSSSDGGVALVGAGDGVASGVAAGVATIQYKVTATGCAETKSVTVLAPPCTSHTPNVSAKNRSVEIFPNPANDECTINCEGALYAGANVAVYDVAGRLVRTYSLKKNNTVISVSGLSQGVYQFKVDIDGNGIINKKLTIVR